METYTLTIVESSTGRTLTAVVNVPLDRDKWGSNYRHLSPEQYAVAKAAPDVCPFDCDYCR